MHLDMYFIQAVFDVWFINGVAQDKLPTTGPTKSSVLRCYSCGVKFSLICILEWHFVYRSKDSFFETERIVFDTQKMLFYEKNAIICV